MNRGQRSESFADWWATFVIHNDNPYLESTVLSGALAAWDKQGERIEELEVERRIRTSQLEASHAEVMRLGMELKKIGAAHGVGPYGNTEREGE